MVKSALIVDDSRLARLTLRRLLQKHDIETFEAEGVLDAEEWLERNSLPDVVFMDIMMPKLDGYAGLARLRENPETRSIPVIMYSGDVSEEARQKARDAGATGYLPKPAEASRLDSLIEALNEKMPSKSEPVKEPETLEIKAENFSMSAFTPPSAMPPPEPAPIQSSAAAFVPAFEPTLMPSNPQPSQVAKAVEPAPTTAPVNLGMDLDLLKNIQEKIERVEKSLSNDITYLTNKVTAVEQSTTRGAGDLTRIERLEDTVQNRINEVEHRIGNIERKPIDNSASERLQRDIILIQRQVADFEKRSKLTLALAVGSLVLGLLAIIWHFV